MVIIQKGNANGALYVEDISYNKLNRKKSEYEVLLQNSAEFSIIEAQKFREKIIVVVEVV